MKTCSTIRKVFTIIFVLISFENYSIAWIQPIDANKNAKSLISNLSSFKQNPQTKAKTKIQKHVDSKILQKQIDDHVQKTMFTLKADKDHVQIYEEVKFSLEPAKQVINSTYHFTFIIDGNIKIEKAKDVNYVVYRFRNTGKHSIAASAVASPQIMTHTFQPPTINSISVQVDSVMFEAIPPELTVGQSILLVTNFQSEKNNVRCRFFLGDSDSFSEWSPGFTRKHICLKPGVYSFFAEIGIQGGNVTKRLTQSIVRKIIVKSEIPKIFTIVLNADKKRVYTGEDIRFSLSPLDSILNIPVDVIFNFGDKQIIKEPIQAKVIHSYNRAEHYTVSIDMEPQNINSNIKLIPKNTIDIQVDSIPLYVNNSAPDTGEIVEIETELRSDEPLTRYRFFFGDNSAPSQWSNQPKVLHKYYTPDNYFVYAEIGKQSGSSIINVSRSIGKIVKVSFKPVPDHAWIYILIILAAAVTFLSIRKHYFSVRPHLKPNIDLGKQQLKEGNQLKVNYEIRFNPNFKKSVINIHRNNNNIIKDLKRKNE